MSYEDALEAARGWQAPLPPLSAPASRSALPWTRGRVMAALGIAVALYGYLGIWLDALGSEHVAQQEAMGSFLVPIAIVVTCGALLRRNSFRTQLLLRAMLWSNVVIGALLSVFIVLPACGPGGAVVAMGSAMALLGVMRTPLAELPPDPTFQPVAFFARLVAALAMAFADAQTLLFSAVSQTVSSARQAHNTDATAFDLLGHLMQHSALTWLAAGVMALAVWGLLRLRTWALVLNIAANFAIAGLALNGYIEVSIPVAGSLAATALLQLLLPVPVIAAALGDRGVRREASRMATLMVSIAIWAPVALTLPGLAVLRPLADQTWSEIPALRRSRATPQPGPGQAWYAEQEAAAKEEMNTGPHGRFPFLEPSANADGMELEGDVEAQRRLDATQASFRNAKVSGTWRSATVFGADFSGSTWTRLEGKRSAGGLRGADARQIVARDAHWAGVHMSGMFDDADFRGLRAPGSTWRDARLAKASFEAADLQRAEFVWTTSHDLAVDFRGADLRGARFVWRSQMRFEDLVFDDANLEGVELAPLRSGIENASFAGAICPDGSEADDQGGTCIGHLELEGGIAPRMYAGYAVVDGTTLLVTASPVYDPFGVLPWRRAEAPTRALSLGTLLVHGEACRRPLLFPWLSLCDDTQTLTPGLPTEARLHDGKFTLAGAPTSEGASLVATPRGLEGEIDEFFGEPQRLELRPVGLVGLWLRMPVRLF